MGCAWCDEDVWVCAEGTPQCFEMVAVEETPAADWTRLGCIELAADDYYVKCKPGGCDAKVETDPSAQSPWVVLNGTEPLSLERGWYLLCCRTGTGQRCSVKLTKFNNKNGCESANCDD